MRHNYCFILISLFFTYSHLNAQETIVFVYDQGGNQILRTFSEDFTFLRAETENEKETKQALAEEETEILSEDSNLRYYPNPVDDVLHMQWQNNENTFLAEVRVYNLTGQQLQVFVMDFNDNNLNIDFSIYEQGVYMLNLYYSNGEVTSIKAVKA
ncbi:MAG: T9SS type A sorting domain-containing protein [Xanthomarina gelatinilytica]|uniref:T9SS type A sorting domain-containing protein n=1 Tax=Xanthomarina gelatinilytica TaxID=1137281 RepID=UPI003A8427FE